jgi:oxygen-independent coproporphyrinogen-3 oxidase
MVEAIVKELELQKNYLQGVPLETVYFGGGTPSLLSRREMLAILDGIRRFHALSSTAEVTLEANPDDLGVEKLAELRELGVNRLSIGVQSFDDKILRYFNRSHSSQQSHMCIADARKAGFDNISIDLIYGIPGLDHDNWLHNIQASLALNPEHISAYSLTIEEKTVFGKQVAKGRLNPMPEELVAVQFEMLMSEMESARYEHYEISNFSKLGHRSRHNTSYWEQKPYLGVGPSAHSYNGRSRRFNIANNPLYVKALGEGRLPFEEETLTPSNIINEFIMTRLRMKDGLDLAQLKEKFGYDLTTAHRAYLDSLHEMEKIEYRKQVMVLTNKGKLLADKISADLFVSSE